MANSSKVVPVVLRRARELGREFTYKDFLDLATPNYAKKILRELARLPMKVYDRVHVVRFERSPRGGAPLVTYTYGPGSNARKPEPFTQAEKSRRQRASEHKPPKDHPRRVAFLAAVLKALKGRDDITWKDIETPEPEKYIQRLLRELSRPGGPIYLCRMTRQEKGGQPSQHYALRTPSAKPAKRPPPLTYAAKAKRWRKKNPDKVAAYNLARLIPPEEKAAKVAARKAESEARKKKKSMQVVTKSIERVTSDPFAAFLYGKKKSPTTP